MIYMFYMRIIIYFQEITIKASPVQNHIGGQNAPAAIGDSSPPHCSSSQAQIKVCLF